MRLKPRAIARRFAALTYRRAGTVGRRVLGGEGGPDGSVRA